jgi:hypothetical protein
VGEPGSIRLPGPLIVMLKPPPLVLNFGPGKFGTPCERMHWANVIASPSSLPGLELAGYLEGPGGVGSAFGTPVVEVLALLPLVVPKLAVRVAPGPPHATRFMAAVAAKTANPPDRQHVVVLFRLADGLGPIFPTVTSSPSNCPCRPLWGDPRGQLYGTDGYTKVTRVILLRPVPCA